MRVHLEHDRHASSICIFQFCTALYSYCAEAYSAEMKTPDWASGQTESHGLTAYSSRIFVKAAGKMWFLERAASLEQLWNAMTESGDDFDDERLPYWTELWPSSVALANWLHTCKDDICGRFCLDMGCGLGLTAMVAQDLGASVLAMDYEFEALNYARHNTLANAMSAPLWTQMDWRKPAVRKGALYRIWGGDIMYEKRFVAPILRFMAHALALDGKAWLAEPGRTIYDSFLHALQSEGWQGRPVYSEVVEPLYAQPVPVTVKVWEIQRR